MIVCVERELDSYTKRERAIREKKCYREKKRGKSVKKYKLNFQDGKKFNSSVTECLLIPEWVNVFIHCLKKWVKKQSDKNCR